MNPPKSPPPFCCNCSNFIDVTDVDNGDGRLPRCRAFQMTDLVLGEKFYLPCSDVRTPNAPCGTAGRMFQPKPVAPASN